MLCPSSHCWLVVDLGPERGLSGFTNHVLSVSTYFICMSVLDLCWLFVCSTSLGRRKIPWKGTLPRSPLADKGRSLAQHSSPPWSDICLSASPILFLLMLPCCSSIDILLFLHELFIALQKRHPHSYNHVSLLLPPILLPMFPSPLFILCDNSDFFFKTHFSKWILWFREGRDNKWRLHWDPVQLDLYL